MSIFCLFDGYLYTAIMYVCSDFLVIIFVYNIYYPILTVFPHLIQFLTKIAIPAPFSYWLGFSIT